MIDVGHIIAIYGYKWETKDFYNAVAYTYLAAYKQEYPTVEVLLCHPSVAIQFCGEIRKRTELPTLPDDVILTCLVNLRKRKYIKLVEETVKKNMERETCTKK
jgi:hypothetical protein